ncbi:hypothetical protein KA005_21350 [bacterium]|nr:hypothetical protein [bacterium]
MAFNSFSALGTGGLEDFDETERVKAEIRPLVEELVKKAEEINVPIHVTVCSSMRLEPKGIGSSLVHICRGRKENGVEKLPVTFKALSSVAQDVNLAMETALKYLGQRDPISAILKNAFTEALSGTDSAREIRVRDPLDCKNCDKKDECPIRPAVEAGNEMLKDLGIPQRGSDMETVLRNLLSAFNNKFGRKPVEDKESARIDRIIRNGAELEDEEE